MRVRLLGSFQVSVGHRTIEEDRWRLRKAAGLVKLLALAAGHRMHRERVMDLLWPELATKAAANNLRRVLHVARRTLEPASDTASRYYLRLEGNLLVLCPNSTLRVDVEAFEQAAATARRLREPAAYRAALDLYAGDLLPGDLYEEWAHERREQLHRTYLDLLIEMAALYEERKDFSAATETLRKVVTDEPTHEGAHIGLMHLYALTGQRQAALGQYERLREALRKELGREPGTASQRLYGEILAGKFPPSTPSPPVGFTHEEKPAENSSRHNLPSSLSSFVGRERELVEAKRMLAMTRLLTLTGAGGSGKTRLALEVAKDLVGAYPEGVWLVELAPLSDPALAPLAVAQALGVREQPGRSLEDALADHLRTKEDLLLVLDNCEHLVEAVARLGEALLKSCPKLRILATSREPLGVPGETVWTVLPLSLPDTEGASSIEGLMSAEAVRLFSDRARSRLPGFELTEENARAVGRICWKLEGIPLAIELAAARMGTLAVEQVALRLEDSLKLLTGGGRAVEPRQQTLRATLDWSHELLSEAERELFGRLSVFARGFTLEAAEEVCSGEGIDEDEVLDLLSKLVDKSLVVAEAEKEGVLRYRMLEPTRQYGREKLEENGETERVRERHAKHYLKLAERAEPELMGARPAAWLERLELEHDNLRAALSWTLDAEEEHGERAEMGLRLAAALGRFWDAYGPGEGRRWLEKGLAKSDAAPASVRAKALNEAGFIAVYEGDPQAMTLLEESLALYKELDDRSGMAYTMSNLGHAVLHLGDRERMLSLRQEVEALLSQPLDRRVRAHLLLFLSSAALSEVDFEQMEAPWLEEALALFRESGDIRGLAVCLPSLGMISLSQGDSERAAALFEEGLHLQRELKYKMAIFFGLLGMAGVAALRRQPARAAKLFGASEALREAIDLVFTPLTEGHFGYEGYLAAARAGLDGAAFDAAFSEGRAMSPEQAIEYALSAADASPQEAAVPERSSTVTSDSLTRRQREVTLLVGRGLTNHQIAKELSISERTVDAHVRKILKKLGLRSRAQIAAWVAEQWSVHQGLRGGDGAAPYPHTRG